MAYQEGQYAITKFTLEETGTALRLTITPSEDSHGLLPLERTLYLKFRDVEMEEMCITLGTSPVVIELTDVKPIPNVPAAQLKSAIFTRLQGSNDRKNLLLKKYIPANVQQAAQELDALIY